MSAGCDWSADVCCLDLVLRRVVEKTEDRLAVGSWVCRSVGSYVCCGVARVSDILDVCMLWGGACVGYIGRMCAVGWRVASPLTTD